MSEAKKCPFMGGKKCITHQCQLWIHLVGLSPQTGQPVDEWNCSFAWGPLLQVEAANETRKCAASVDKVANEVNKVRTQEPSKIVYVHEPKPVLLENIDVEGGNNHG